MNYKVYKHYRDDLELEKEFTDLKMALAYCLEDDTLCRENGHALSIRKNYTDSIFEINYYGNTEINIDSVATEEELHIINDFVCMN